MNAIEDVKKALLPGTREIKDMIPDVLDIEKQLDILIAAEPVLEGAVPAQL